MCTVFARAYVYTYTRVHAHLRYVRAVTAQKFQSSTAFLDVTSD